MDITKDTAQKLGPILARALNKNQILILSETVKNRDRSITSLLLQTASKSSIPLSTLKLNARILKRLGLLSFGDGNPAKITCIGELTLKSIGAASKIHAKLVKK